MKTSNRSVPAPKNGLFSLWDLSEEELAEYPAIKRVVEAKRSGLDTPVRDRGEEKRLMPPRDLAADGPRGANDTPEQGYAVLGELEGS